MQISVDLTMNDKTKVGAKLLSKNTSHVVVEFYYSAVINLSSIEQARELHAATAKALALFESLENSND